MNTLRVAIAHRTSARGDHGFTLVEALVAIVIFGMTISVMTSAVMAMVRNMRQADGVSVASDQVRLGFQRLDKQVRYATAISTPGPAGAGWYVELRMESTRRDVSALASVSTAQQNQMCHQWRVLARRLQWRSWEVSPAGVAIGPSPAWRTVATGVTNDFTASPPAEPPFHTTPVAAAVGAVQQHLTVDLRSTRSRQPPGRAHLRATIFARNTTATTSPVGVCTHFSRS